MKDNDKYLMLIEIITNGDTGIIKDFANSDAFEKTHDIVDCICERTWSFTSLAEYLRNDGMADLNAIVEDVYQALERKREKEDGENQ